MSQLPTVPFPGGGQPIPQGGEAFASAAQDAQLVQDLQQLFAQGVGTAAQAVQFGNQQTQMQMQLNQAQINSRLAMQREAAAVLDVESVKLRKQLDDADQKFRASQERLAELALVDEIGFQGMLTRFGPKAAQEFIRKNPSANPELQAQRMTQIGTAKARRDQDEFAGVIGGLYEQAHRDGVPVSSLLNSAMITGWLNQQTDGLDYHAGTAYLDRFTQQIQALREEMVHQEIAAANIEMQDSVATDARDAAIAVLDTALSKSGSGGYVQTNIPELIHKIGTEYDQRMADVGNHKARPEEIYRQVNAYVADTMPYEQAVQLAHQLGADDSPVAAWFGKDKPYDLRKHVTVTGDGAGKVLTNEAVRRRGQIETRWRDTLADPPNDSVAYQMQLEQALEDIEGMIEDAKPDLGKNKLSPDEATAWRTHVLAPLEDQLAEYRKMYGEQILPNIRTQRYLLSMMTGKMRHAVGSLLPTGQGPWLRLEMRETELTPDDLPVIPLADTTEHGAAASLVRAVREVRNQIEIQNRQEQLPVSSVAMALQKGALFAGGWAPAATTVGKYQKEMRVTIESLLDSTGVFHGQERKSWINAPEFHALRLFEMMSDSVGTTGAWKLLQSRTLGLDYTDQQKLMGILAFMRLDPDYDQGSFDPRSSDRFSDLLTVMSHIDDNSTGDGDLFLTEWMMRKQEPELKDRPQVPNYTLVNQAINHRLAEVFGEDVQVTPELHSMYKALYNFNYSILTKTAIENVPEVKGEAKHDKIAKMTNEMFTDMYAAWNSPSGAFPVDRRATGIGSPPPDARAIMAAFDLAEEFGMELPTQIGLRHPHEVEGMQVGPSEKVGIFPYMQDPQVWSDFEKRWITTLANSMKGGEVNPVDHVPFTSDIWAAARNEALIGLTGDARKEVEQEFADLEPYTDRYTLVPVTGEAGTEYKFWPVVPAARIFEMAFFGDDPETLSAARGAHTLHRRLGATLKPILQSAIEELGSTRGGN